MPEGSLPKLKELSEFVNEVANVRHDVRASRGWARPLLRTRAACTSTPSNASPRSYEHINPETVGNFRRVLVSDMSGRSNILLKAQELGFELAADARRRANHRPGQGTGSPPATNTRPPKARWP